MSDAVLVVDDEPHILQAIKRLLRRDGYEIHLAENGPAALEMLAHREVAVIVCDQRMPGMTGAEVLAESARLQPDAFRITLTGYTDLAAAQRSINQGKVNQFLLKPWEDEHLRAAVREGVRTSRMIRENRRLNALTHQQKNELEQWNRKLEATVRERTEELHARNASLLELQRQLEQSLRDTVAVLANMLEAYDLNLGIHSKRVAQLARQLASQLDVEDQELRDIEFAAYLHDIGKIARLSADHRSRAGARGRKGAGDRNRHAQVGYAMLARVGGFDEVARGVRHQGERFDGSGAPDGLKGARIPLASRIIAVAGAYDQAVFSSREPTKVTRERGRRVLLKGGKTEFDPDLVRMLLEYLDTIGAEVGDDPEVEVSPKQIQVGMVLARDLKNLDGVLLLKGGTRLTSQLIDRLRNFGDDDSLLGAVFVRCPSEVGQRDDSEVGRTGSPHALTDVAKARVPSDEPADQMPDPPAQVQESAQPIDQRITSVGSHSNRGGPSSEAPPRLEHAALTPGHGALGDPTDETMLSPTVRRASDDRAPSAPKEVGSRTKVLIVDDDLLICNALKRDLRHAGFETIVTHSGTEALELVRQTQFHVVVSDLFMPQMSGEELVERLGQAAPTLPCILMTANTTRRQVAKLATMPNVAGFLLKPWDRQKLFATLTAAIDHGKKQSA